jgi:dethiobiotin synthetase
MNPIFITGIGTGIGKTIVSSILVEALQADYWKPIQAGYENGTDLEWVRDLISNQKTRLHPETYRLKMAASPHIAARAESLEISLGEIELGYNQIKDSNSRIVIEGAGGLLVPINQKEFVIDLIKKLQADVILVSRNYLGSINHSLLTASLCRQNNLNVIGWIFNDQYLDYEDEIVVWSGYKKLASVPKAFK